MQNLKQLSLENTDNSRLWHYLTGLNKGYFKYLYIRFLYQESPGRWTAAPSHVTEVTLLLQILNLRVRPAVKRNDVGVRRRHMWNEQEPSLTAQNFINPKSKGKTHHTSTHTVWLTGELWEMQRKHPQTDELRVPDRTNMANKQKWGTEGLAL